MTAEAATPSARGIGALFGDVAVYGSARVLASALGVVFIPLYTRVLAVEDYGVLENLSTLSFFVVTVFGLSLPTAITKDYAAA
jgi:O-antigen/teichoic acid export membrane protein